ncbi:hypothetical protein PINS_up001322 [Pythium insidiosum]|nr:hypothetical protein PINS_up001322 [Pythium insidiosum]
MNEAQSMPMPEFVARCLEEVGLEGRCGLPVRDMFALVDDAGDTGFRRYAWHVLRAMGEQQLRFYYMLRTTSETQQEMTATPVKRGRTRRRSWDACEESTTPPTPQRREKRRRKWSTTLAQIDEGTSTQSQQRSLDSDADTEQWRAVLAVGMDL